MYRNFKYHFDVTPPLHRYTNFVSKTNIGELVALSRIVSPCNEREWWKKKKKKKFSFFLDWNFFHHNKLVTFLVTDYNLKTKN